jgi:FkbM family methyltransferase
VTIANRFKSMLGHHPEATQTQADNDGGLTREHVIWAFRLFLDRDPGGEAFITEKLVSNSNTQDLRRVFMLSPEFVENNRDLMLFYESHVVIKEIHSNLRLFVDLSDSVISWQIMRGNYESNELEFVRRTVKPGQTALDIGANIGVFTITMGSLVGPTGRVYAFEPLEAQAALLERSIAENNFADRVVLERAALSDKAGTALLISALKSNNGGGAYLKHRTELVPAGHKASDVKVITLDAYPVKRPVSFVKIDIEGAEPLAFRGGRTVLQEDRPVILSELHPAQLLDISGCTTGEFIAEMESLGYRCHNLHGAEPAPYTDDGVLVKPVVFLPA